MQVHAKKTIQMYRNYDSSVSGEDECYLGIIIDTSIYNYLTC